MMRSLENLVLVWTLLVAMQAYSAMSSLLQFLISSEPSRTITLKEEWRINVYTEIDMIHNNYHNKWLIKLLIVLYRVAKKKEQSIQDFALINSYLFFTWLDRVSFPHYNNTKIIKFGWELFILWVISYGLSFLGFARFPEFRGTINDKLMANPENDSP